MTRQGASGPDPADIVVRHFEGHADYRACVELQNLTWGSGFHECVPPSMLLIAQKTGGIAAGAFDRSGKLLGFVFGLTGVRKGRLAHWSHMLAVRPEAQRLGLGRRLKLFQRETLLPLGIETIYWTYDPLVARNANLNFNRLGVRVEEYVRDLYGPDTASELHSGLGTDRFVVAWPIASADVTAIVDGSVPSVEAAASAPVITADDHGQALPEDPAVIVAIPADIHELLAQDRDRAWEWRLATRHAFTWYLGRGYRVSGFSLGPPGDFGRYVLVTDASGHRS